MALPERQHLVTMQNFAGMLDFLTGWRWKSRGVVAMRSGVCFSVSALPLLVDDYDAIQELGAYAEGEAVFRDDHQWSAERKAFEYLL